MSATHWVGVGCSKGAQRGFRGAGEPPPWMPDTLIEPWCFLRPSHFEETLHCLWLLNQPLLYYQSSFAKFLKWLIQFSCSLHSKRIIFFKGAFIWPEKSTKAHYSCSISYKARFPIIHLVATKFLQVLNLIVQNFFKSLRCFARRKLVETARNGSWLAYHNNF